MKKLFFVSMIALSAMFTFSSNASAEEKSNQNENEEVEVVISDSEQMTSKSIAKEVEEFSVFVREDGSILVIHTQTVQL